jgi:hypothetical protein
LGRCFTAPAPGPGRRAPAADWPQGSELLLWAQSAAGR